MPRSMGRAPAATLAFAAAIVAVASGAPRAATPPSPDATLREYCVTCHSQRLKTGGLSLEGLDATDVAHDAETWEKVVRKLRLGTMPPQGARRPDGATYAQTIASLEGRLDAAAAARPAPGRPVLHRLNRTEYANAVRDLLGLDVDVSALLPPDDAAYGFDNVADSLGSSPALLQAYLSAARKISAVAVGDPRVGVGSDTYSVRQDLSQDKHLDGLPLGTFGGMTARHLFPLDGEYDFQVRLYRTNLNAMRGVQERHQVELTIDGERVLLARVRRPRRSGSAAGESDRDVRRDRGETAAASPVREGRTPRARGRVSRGDAGDPRHVSAAAVPPRLRQPVRGRRPAARAVHQHPGPVQHDADRRRAESERVRLPAVGDGGRRSGDGMRHPHPVHAGTPRVSPPRAGRGSHGAAGVLSAGARTGHLRERRGFRSAPDPGEPVIRLPPRA